MRHWMSNGEAGIGDAQAAAALPRANPTASATLFYGSKGYLAVDSYTSYKTWLGREQEPGPASNEGGDHFLNFIEAVRSRKRET